MKVNMSFASHVLAKHIIASNFSTEYQLTLSALRILKDSTLENDVLYITDKEGLNDIQLKKATHLVVCDESIDSAPPANLPCNWIFATGIKCSDAIELLANEWVRTSEHFIETVFSNSLHSLIRNISKLVDNPIVAYNSEIVELDNYGFPSNYSNPLFNNGTIQDSELKRSMPECQPEGDWKPGSDLAIMRNFAGYGNDIVCFSIYRDSGLIGMIESWGVNHAQTDWEISLLHGVMRAAQKSAARYIVATDDALTIKSLLSKNANPALIKRWCVQWGLKCNEPFCAAFIVLGDENDLAANGLDYPARLLNEAYPKAHFSQFDNGIVGIIPIKSHSRASIATRIVSCLGTDPNKFHLGISEVFASIDAFASPACMQASFAARYKRGITLFSNSLAIDWMCQKAEIDAQSYEVLDTRIIRMAQDDKEGEGDNLATLSSFLRNGSNVVKTAESLSLHRNTVQYRMRKISERYGIDCSKEMDIASLTRTLLTISAIQQNRS